MVYDCHDDDGGGLGVVVDDNDGDDDDVDDNGDDGGDGDEEYSAYYFLDLSDQAGRRGTSGFSEFVSSWFCYKHSDCDHEDPHAFEYPGVSENRGP